MVLRSVVFVLASASVVAAQPAPCTVRVAAAPDDVRAVIEAWVAAEPRCLRELEVRVVPTEAGLHLSARDGAGQVRERIVPDAQSAAVLVVSWMADDSIQVAPEVEAMVEPAPAAPAIVLAPLGMDDEQPLVVEHHAQHPARPWLTLGIIGAHGSGGVRAQADLVVHGRWILGLAASVQGDGYEDRHNSDRMGPSGGTASANAFVARTHSLGRVVVRMQLGVGADARATQTMTETIDHSVAPALNAALLGQVRINGRWGLVGGPVLDVPLDRDDHPSVAAFFGVQYGR